MENYIRKYIDSDGNNAQIEFAGDLHIYSKEGSNEWAISINEQWVNAIFDSRETCIKAGEIGWDVEELWKKINPVLPTENLKLITLQMLQELCIPKTEISTP